MPYIKQELRGYAEQFPDTAGELNYAITTLLIGYVNRNQRNYQALNDCLGALEGAKLEFYRRVVVPFEENKKALNGDVYE